MLKSIQKFFATNVAQPAQANQQEEVGMTVKQEGQTEMAAEVNTAELMANLSQATEALAAMQTQFAELTSKYEAAQAALAEIEAAKAALVAEAHEKKMSARKQRVEMAIGTEKAPAMLSATEQLDDAQFEAVVSAMASSFEAESKSAMFQEVGVSAEVDPTKTVEESAEMRALKQKYQAK